MGYAYNGKCYQDGAAALEGFKASFPMADSNGIIHLNSATEGAGTITYSIFQKSLSGTGTKTTTGAFPLTPCTEDLSQWDPSTVLWIAALFFAAVIGFRTGFRP